MKKNKCMADVEWVLEMATRMATRNATCVDKKVMLNILQL